MKEIFIPAYPCLYDYNKICVECPNLAGNIHNLRLLLRDRNICYRLNKAGIDEPSIQNLCDLLFNLDNDMAIIPVGKPKEYIVIDSNLKDLGYGIASMRRKYALQIYQIDELFPPCPNIK